jgi:hypothetical protein
LAILREILMIASSINQQQFPPAALCENKAKKILLRRPDKDLSQASKIKQPFRDRSCINHESNSLRRGTILSEA